MRDVVITAYGTTGYGLRLAPFATRRGVALSMNKCQLNVFGYGTAASNTLYGLWLDLPGTNVTVDVQAS